MAVSQTRAEVAYGRTSPLILLPDQTVRANRNPTDQDKKEIGTFWVNQTDNSVYIITNIRGISTWIALTGGEGIFTNLEVTGDLTVDGDTELNNLDVSAQATIDTLTVTGDTVLENTEVATLDATNAIFSGIPVGATNATESIELAGGLAVLTGDGVPDNAAAVNIGDLYINTTAASDVTRLYIATAVGAWTNITCAA